MAQRAENRETLTCSICLDLLKEPVTIPCGHSYCRSCIHSHWAQEDSRFIYSCPECRQRFRTRPVLGKNIKMAALLEQMKERAPPVGDCVARPGDVLCDVCSGNKLKAVHSCLQCLASYCERHLQRHRDVAGLQRHQLVAPSHNLQDYLCSEHNEVKKLFCRSDQQLLCVICCMEQHKHHDTVSSATERAQRQPQLEDRRQQLLKTIKDSETDLRRLQEEAQAISRSAQDAVQHSRNIFTQMIHLLKTRLSEVEQEIRDCEKSKLRQIQELQNQAQLDITQKKKTFSEMDTLLKTQDHLLFLQLCSNLPSHGPITPVTTVLSKNQHHFESVTTAVSALRQKIQHSLIESKTDVSKALKEIHTLLFRRQEFLKYACDITMDPNTAHTNLCLSEGNRRVTQKTEEQNYPYHPDRFKAYGHVLSREALTGRCYWEMECQKSGGARLAVAYKDIVKSFVSFGDNDQSWAIDWYCDTLIYMFNGNSSDLRRPSCLRVGVFLDHSAGLLSFFSVKDQTLSLIHRVQTTFIQPLHVGVGVSGCIDDDTIYFPKLKNH